ncbi:hypothetical protein OS493_003808 [Desmophyllum pertusum]|uniref:Uncharacterized protein n=1 Tax=Desmophyllum pertusum TaxID=174260 RepID=A0A9X0A6X6_9CNID|nr:hypothetical protein OS493_003808 [Desmophyllum pertusum]
MRCFLLTVTVLVLVATPAIALKCYECTGNDDTCSKSTLEKDQDKYLKECSGDRCYRQWLHKDGATSVANTCSSQLGCGLAEALCKSLEDGNDVDCASACCSTDACNAGSTASISVLLLTVCSFIGLALLK